MATGDGRRVPTLEELTTQRGSRLEATVERSRYFEHIRPPVIGQAPPVEEMATLDPRPEVDSDDLLDQALGVRILYAGGLVGSFGKPALELRRRHETIEGLIAWRKLTAQTLTMLSSLRFLQLAANDATPELQAAFPVTLEEIWADGLDLGALSRLPQLRYLRTKVRSGRVAQSHALAALSQLRSLHIEVLEALRGSSALGRLEHLENFSINAVSNLDFAALAGCRRLKYLSLGGLGSTKTLDGIDGLEALEGLSLGGRRCPPISPIARVPRLHSLSVSSIQAPPDLDAVGKMRQLRSLVLFIGSVSSPHTLRSAALFSELHLLEGLRCVALLEDKDLTPLMDLKHLKYVSFLGTFPADEVRRLQAHLPDCKIDVTVGEGPPAQRRIEVGLLTATLDDDGRWMVWQDLRVNIDCRDNHVAEAAVKAELRRANPDVLKRIVFDSENDGFGAYLESREDLEPLATAVAVLAAKHP